MNTDNRRSRLRRGTITISENAATVDELVESLRAGSPVIDSRLSTIYASAADSDADYLLDQVALSAASGSPYALRLLLTIIDEHNLAVPAIRRYLPNPATQDDVRQEVLIAVTRAIHRFRGDSKFRTWLYSIARNSAVAELRRSRASSGPDATYDEELDGVIEAERFSSRAVSRHLVENAVLALPTIFRDIVYLRDIEHLSYEEIATGQGLAINTVRSRLSRGRALLSAQLAEVRKA